MWLEHEGSNLNCQLMWFRNFGDLGLGPYGVWLAHRSRRSKRAASEGIMHFDGLGLRPYEAWLAHRSTQSELRARMGIMSFAGLGSGPYEMWLSICRRRSELPAMRGSPTGATIQEASQREQGWLRFGSL